MAKAKPKRKYATAEELELKIREYEQSVRGKCFADEAGMRIHIGLTKSEIAELCDENKFEDAAEFVAVFERAADRRESSLIRRMVTEPKSANGCMNALKQKANGGYTDKPTTDNAPQTLNIHIVGGHGSELFK